MNDGYGSFLLCDGAHKCLDVPSHGAQVVVCGGGGFCFGLAVGAAILGGA